MDTKITNDPIYNIGEEQDFIQRVDHLAAEMGDEIFQSVVAMLCDLRIEAGEARLLWHQLVEHWSQMKQKGWDICFFSSMSDYLFRHTDYFQKPKLTELEYYEQLLQQLSHDPLTGMLNKRNFQQSLEQHFSLARREQNFLSIMFLDVDNFKLINDTYGHLFGDQVLKKISQIINHEKRTADISARFGGEEFVLIMPGTNCKDALVLGERIRTAIEQAVFIVGDETHQTTISGGIASYPVHADTIDQLIYYADSAVYRAKGAGKNLIALFKEESRRYLRVAMQEEVQVKILDTQISIPSAGELMNIGFGGVLFQSTQEMPIGTTIQINIMFKDQPLILIGNIARIEKISAEIYEIGVSLAFHQMEVSARHRISDLLSDKRLSLNM